MVTSMFIDDMMTAIVLFSLSVVPDLFERK